MTERLLADVMVHDETWRDLTRYMIEDADEGFELFAHENGRFIADKLVMLEGCLVIEDLRECTSWLNALDREAMELTGGNFNDLGEEDLLEAIMRRLVHHSLRVALGAVKSEARRNLYLHNYRGWLSKCFSELPEQHIDDLVQERQSEVRFV